MENGITTYLADVQDSMNRINAGHLQAIADALFKAYLDRSTVYTIGNGASAALAAHLACDLGKGTATDLGMGCDVLSRQRLRIVSLTDNMALITAYGNDIDYNDVFLEQLKNLLVPGDVVLGVSGSGGSLNVLRALSYARKLGATTLGLTGMQSSAHRMQSLCDVCAQAPSDMMEQIEDIHVMIGHTITVTLRSMIAAHHAASQAGMQDVMAQHLAVAPSAD